MAGRAVWKHIAAMVVLGSMLSFPMGSETSTDAAKRNAHISRNDDANSTITGDAKNNEAPFVVHRHWRITRGVDGPYTGFGPTPPRRKPAVRNRNTNSRRRIANNGRRTNRRTGRNNRTSQTSKAAKKDSNSELEWRYFADGGSPVPVEKNRKIYDRQAKKQRNSTIIS